MLSTLLQMDTGTLTIGTLADTKQKTLTLMAKGKQPLAVIFDVNDADSVASVIAQIEQYIGNQESIVDATNITTITKAAPKKESNKTTNKSSAKDTSATTDKQKAAKESPTQTKKSPKPQAQTTAQPTQSTKPSDNFSDLLSDLGI